MNPELIKDALLSRWSDVASTVYDLSEAVHGFPELAFEEAFAATSIGELLEHQGFTLEKGICDLPTAFVASYGTGSLAVALCAEYDALPSIGHACGHNLIAAMAVGTALTLQPLAGLLDITIKVVGTPGEESGDNGGKILLLERGAFAGVHLAMMVHPAPFDSVDLQYTAAMKMEINFSGDSGHSASSIPATGNALHALTLAQVAVSLLSSTLDSFSKINGVITDGGVSPNVTPEQTSITYLVRSRTSSELKALGQQLARRLAGVADASACTIHIVNGDGPYAEMRQDPVLLRLYRANAERLGRSFTAMRSTQHGGPSTDMGNLSQAIPCIHPCIGIGSWPASNHQRSFTSYCIGPTANKAIRDGSLAMAGTIIDVACDPNAKMQFLASAAQGIAER